MGIFSTIITGVQDALKPISGLVKELADDFKEWLTKLTAKDVLQFFSSIKEGIEGFIESFKKGEIGAIVEDTLNVFIGLGKMVIGTIQGIAKAWMALPEGFRDAVRPIIIIVALVIQLFGGLMNIVFLMVALNALWTSLGLKITLSGALLAGVKAILVGIMWTAGVIGAVLVGWTLGSIIGELSIIKSWFTSWALAIHNIGPSLKLIAMSMLALQQPWRLLNKEFKSEMATTLEEVKIGFMALGELDWFGTKDKNNVAPKPGKAGEEAPGAGKGYLEINGNMVDIEALLAKDELNSLKAMQGQAERMGSILGASERTSMLADLQERINDLEKIVMDQEGNLEALNRQTIKPEADRKNKARIGAGLE
jgi:hypothetical protein